MPQLSAMVPATTAGGISKIVNRVREQSDASRKEHDDKLHRGCNRQTCEAPLDRPQTALVVRDGRIDHPVGVAVTTIRPAHGSIPGCRGTLRFASNCQ